MLSKLAMRTIAACSVAIIAGCASFAKNQIPEVTSMPSVEQYQNKPSVYIDFRFFQGDPQTAQNPVEIAAAKTQLQPMVERTVQESLLFSRSTFDAFEQDKTDYTIKVYAYNHGNHGGAAIMGFITGFTLGVIPSAATDNFTLVVEASGKDGANLSNTSNQDAVTTWIGLWFIPLMGNTPDEAITDTLENQLRTALKELVESGKLQYSGATVPFRNA